MGTQQQIKLKVLLVGDNCEDIYQYGTVNRISPEAPVPVFLHDSTETKPGMAGNVLANLRALGIEVDFVTSDNISKKTRIIDSRSKQHLIRIDNDYLSAPIKISQITNLEYDAVVISDYNKGVVDNKLIMDLRAKFLGPIFLDTKKTDLSTFSNIFVKINELEYKNLTHQSEFLIVTLGHKGTRFKDIVYPTINVEVVDITGAGDTFLAALTYQYCIAKDIITAIKFANRAAAITVQHFGVYAPTMEEICDYKV